jgi:hypothetical protein
MYSVSLIHTGRLLAGLPGLFSMLTELRKNRPNLDDN